MIHTLPLSIHFQIKALQTNYFINHLIEVLLKDHVNQEVSNPKNNNTKAKNASEDTDNTTTISSSYDCDLSEYDSLISQSEHQSLDHLPNQHQTVQHGSVAEEESSYAGYDCSARTLYCANHFGKPKFVPCTLSKNAQPFS